MPGGHDTTLYSRPFGALLVVTILGFAGFSTVQTVLPLYAVHLGASATMVGLLVAAFSAPSVVVRPAIGALVDRWSRRGVHIFGAACIGVAGFLYLAPSLAIVLLVRMLHGAAWGAFNTAGGTGVAVLAPPSRLGEASAVYNLMPGVASMAMPALSLLLLSALGFPATFALAGTFGLVATAVAYAFRFPSERGTAPLRELPRASFGLPLERHAALPMVIEFLFTTTQTLFWIYPPVLAVSLGIPAQAMAAYYAPMGMAVVASRLVAGRLLDRLSRRTAILLGVGAVATGLALAGAAGSIVMLAIAGCFHALATSMITPSAMAMAIEDAAPDRRGASIATYSLGFQLGVGVGGLAWGATIDLVGFGWTYWLALAGPIAITAIVLRSRQISARDSRRERSQLPDA